MGVSTGKSLRHHVKLIPGETRIGRKVPLIAFQVTVMPAQTLIAHSIQLVHSIRSRSQAKLRTIPVAKVWTLLREEMLQVPRPVLISPLHNLLLRRQVCLSIGNFCAIKTISRLTLNCQSTFTMTSGIGLRISWSLHPRKRSGTAWKSLIHHLSKTILTLTLSIRYVQHPNPRKWLGKLSLKKEKRYRRRRKTDNALRKWRNSMACTSNSRSKKQLRVNPSCCHKLQSPVHYCLRWNLLHRKMIQLRWRRLSILIQQMSSYLNCPSLNRISPRSRDLHFTTSTSALLTEGQALMLTILNIRKH